MIGFAVLSYRRSLGPPDFSEGSLTLVHNTYGKGRVRVLRLARGDRHEPRETSVRVMLEGDFGRAYVARDNSTSIATDSIKNIVYVVARENLAA